ncbi:UDP-glucosyltransferase 2-like [Pollicipes pollicipes]|uniref:UDP-glucosyltransferase 2-like n=1 Tax=Pollicipes pollicipes TaxID=41117 RepID=UPI001884EEC8|nr:UDP-glucosyltransferase 2-like [Pollicipes pollicipes]XP_037089987.1 UDP-glucosyltransferase 2-like [Pollicipes pollicipes]
MASPVRVLLLLFCGVMGVESARILMFVPIGGKSQKNIFYGVGNALSSRGHEVVFFNGFKPSSPVKGIREVVPDKLAKMFADDMLPNMFKMNEEGMQAGFKQFATFFSEGPRTTLESKEVDDLLKQKFDLVIFGAFGYPFYFLAHLLKAPFILLTPVSYFPVVTSPLGTPTLPALHPIPFIASNDHMSFMQRVQNVVGHIMMFTVLHVVYPRYADRMVAEKFGAGVIPPASEIERNASLVLLSSNPMIDYHKPLLPNVIEVGGLHCEKAKPLPKEVTSFLGDSQYIFFSLGSVVRPQDMSADQRSAVLNALGSMPFKVLLKWDTTDRTNIPANILPSKWLPQQDILGDSKCRLFISHGGFASVLEALCHGVPLLAMPVTGDQQSNAAHAADLGVAEVLTWESLTSETLQAAIRSAMSPGHRAASRYRQQLLASQPVPPRDLAVHWVEHVIRHGGAPHLRSVGADLNFFQYYSLDVVAFLLAVLVLVLKLLVALVKCCCRCLCRRNTGPAQTKAKRSKRD